MEGIPKKNVGKPRADVWVRMNGKDMTPEELRAIAKQKREEGQTRIRGGYEGGTSFLEDAQMYENLAKEKEAELQGLKFKPDQDI